MLHKGSIYSIAISAARGQLKEEVPQAEVVEGYGIKGDGHAGLWGRQVTCLDWASVKKVNRERGLQAGPGDFAENILIDGLNLPEVKPGNQIRLAGTVILEVTQIGKEDHPSIVSKTFGVSLLPHEGLFARCSRRPD